MLFVIWLSNDQKHAKLVLSEMDHDLGEDMTTFRCQRSELLFVGGPGLGD